MKYCIVEYTYDNIPGFRDKDSKEIECFETMKDAEAALLQYQDKEQFHHGYGAGSGTIEIFYRIEVKQ